MKNARIVLFLSFVPMLVALACMVGVTVFEQTGKAIAVYERNDHTEEYLDVLFRGYLTGNYGILAFGSVLSAVLVLISAALIKWNQRTKNDFAEHPVLMRVAVALFLMLGPLLNLAAYVGAQCALRYGIGFMDTNPLRLWVMWGFIGSIGIHLCAVLWHCAKCNISTPPPDNTPVVSPP